MFISKCIVIPLTFANASTQVALFRLGWLYSEFSLQWIFQFVPKQQRYLPTDGHMVLRYQRGEGEGIFGQFALVVCLELNTFETGL